MPESFLEYQPQVCVPGLRFMGRSLNGTRDVMFLFLVERLFFTLHFTHPAALPFSVVYDPDLNTGRVFSI